MNRTHHGSCHCGAVTFEAELDLMQGTTRCNCSICRRGRFWKAIVPAGAFSLTAGGGNLSEYRFGSGGIVHYFCQTCGIKPFGSGDLEGIGPFYAINVTCLDLSAEEFDRIPVSMEDGHHDRWDRAPDHNGYL